tara:strand:- start:371 stop:895 length:525 start_codon:yes stop_codon:yes gene_type:complete
MDFIFGTPLWKLPPKKFNQKKITEEIYRAKKLDPKGIKVSNWGGYHSGYFFSAPLTDEYIKCRLEDEGGLNFPHRVSERWFNINSKDNMNMPHAHGGQEGLSGVLFITDAPGLSLGHPAQQVYNSVPWVCPDRYDIDGQSGEIVIFPSSIVHWVNPSESDNPRITFAFNVAVNS